MAERIGRIRQRTNQLKNTLEGTLNMIHEGIVMPIEINRGFLANVTTSFSEILEELRSFMKFFLKSESDSVGTNA